MQGPKRPLPAPLRPSAWPLRPCAHPADLFPAHGHLGRDHHRGRAVAGRSLDPAAQLDLFEGGFRRRARDHRADPRTRRGDRRIGRGGAVHRSAPLQILAPAYRRSRPSSGHQHFRNMHRHRSSPIRRFSPSVSTKASTLPTPAFWKTTSLDRVARIAPIKNVVLMCSAINEIDLSALEASRQSIIAWTPWT